MFGSEIDLVISVYEQVADLVDKGWTGLTDWLAKLWDEIKAKVINVGEITGELIGAVKTGLVKTAVEQVVSWAAALNPAGAIGKAVQAIYKVVKWVVDNWSKIQKLAESVVAGVKALIDGSGVEKVAALVEDGVAKVFQSAAGFILSFFGLDAIPKAIRGVVSKLADAVPNKVTELLSKLKKVLVDKLEKLWGGLWGRKEWTAGGEKHKVWADFKRGKVRTASQEQDAAELLKDLKRQADESKNEKAQGLVAKARDELERTQQSVGALQTTAQKAEQKGEKGAKKQGADAKVVKSESNKVQAGLEKLAELIKESQEALGGTCKIGGQQPNKKAGCWRAGTRSRRGVGEERTIEQWRRGRRVATLSPEEGSGAVSPRLKIDPALWREVFLVQHDKDNGGVLTMELLRPLAWLEQQGVAVGAWVPIDLREMGVQGEALVTAVGPCPEIEEGEGCLVTGTFCRSKALVMELEVAGESEVFGVTGSHLVWSEDRQDWVAVKDLDIGERLRAWDGGTPEVESLTACSEPEPVYNIEVEGDHCYRVGQQGLLVHNASTPTYGATKTITFINVLNQSVTAIVGTSASITLDTTNVGGTRSNLSEPGWWSDLAGVAGSTIQLGHILGSQIGGKEKGAANLTPLYTAANTPAMRTCEGFLRSLIESCKYCSVEVTITVNKYGGNTHAPAKAKPVMPVSVTITWKVDDKIKGKFVIDNDPGAATQDPCRVANLPCR